MLCTRLGVGCSGTARDSMTTSKNGLKIVSCLDCEGRLNDVGSNANSNGAIRLSTYDTLADGRRNIPSECRHSWTNHLAEISHDVSRRRRRSACPDLTFHQVPDRSRASWRARSGSGGPVRFHSVHGDTW